MHGFHLPQFKYHQSPNNTNFNYQSILTVTYCIKYKLSHSNTANSLVYRSLYITGVCPNQGLIVSFFSKSTSDWSLDIVYSVCIHTAKCVVGPSPCLSVRTPCDILQKWIIEKGDWSKKMNVQ